MFKNIMVPVDLRHTDAIERALTAAADLARLYRAGVTYVGVTGPEPSEFGHNPQDFAGRLKDFAAQEAARFGHPSAAHAVVSQDPAAELDTALHRAVEETGADLVVMATHEPNLADYLRASHGGTLAANEAVSVLLIRG